MAAFSSHHQPPFIVPDSGYVPNTSNEMSGLLEREVINTTTSFSPIHPSKGLQESPLNVHIHGSLDSSNSIKQYIDSSSMVPELETGDNQATQVVTHLKKKRKTMGCCKVDRQGKCKKENDGMSKNGEEKKLKAERKEKEEEEKKKKKKVPEEAPTGYVLVRAKRGQATDSHSLAERARREKISERMRLLQSLVPGCDKITGKALILDEIINYVQSLQNQVEFLVMKLASVYPMFNDLDTNTPASEDFRNLEPTLPSVPQSDSMELRTTVTGVAPISTSFLHHLHKRSIFLSQDDGDLLGDIDYQTQKLADHYGHSNLSSI